MNSEVALLFLWKSLSINGNIKRGKRNEVSPPISHALYVNIFLILPIASLEALNCKPNLSPPLNRFLCAYPNFPATPKSPSEFVPSASIENVWFLLGVNNMTQSSLRILSFSNDTEVQFIMSEAMLLTLGDYYKAIKSNNYCIELERKDNINLKNSYYKRKW